MKYKLIQGSDSGPRTFEREVSQALDDGWKLQGGVAVMEVELDTYYYQAVVKD